MKGNQKGKQLCFVVFYLRQAQIDSGNTSKKTSLKKTNACLRSTGTWVPTKLVPFVPAASVGFPIFGSHTAGACFLRATGLAFGWVKDGAISQLVGCVLTEREGFVPFAFTAYPVLFLRGVHNMAYGYFLGPGRVVCRRCSRQRNLLEKRRPLLGFRDPLNMDPRKHTTAALNHSQGTPLNSKSIHRSPATTCPFSRVGFLDALKAQMNAGPV